MYKLNYFNFKEYEDKYLITNDLGRFSFLDKTEFEKLIKKEKLSEDKINELMLKRFIYDGSDEIFSINSSRELKKFKFERLLATNLHIFVVSKNCNFNCIYCQAGNLNQGEDYLMDKETAKKCVDMALQSPAGGLSFEFQGGEPLTNFDVIKYMIEYTEEIKDDRKIEYNVVSNLTLLTDDMIDFFAKHNVSVSTSLDGARKLQMINRPFAKGNSYDDTLKNFKKIKDLNINLGAIQTTTKFSLDKYKEIIDEYVKNELSTVFLRPLTKLGKAGSNWERIGYTPEEFLNFYKKSLDYIIELNKKGINIKEGHSTIFLRKILKNESVNYMELRSPCGGAIGQLAYYYDGNVYTCDEGRMLAEMGDKSFYLGNVFENTYQELMETDCTKAMCVSSCLESLPYCHSCVYAPYCGTCPVLNLALDKSIFAKNPNEFRCKIYGGMLDIIFDYLKNNNEILDIFNKWIS